MTPGRTTARRGRTPTRRRGEHRTVRLDILVGDITRRAGQLTDLGHVRVIECADAALATLIARSRATRSLCRLVGDRHLAVPLDAEVNFRVAVRKFGYVMPTS